MRRTVGLRVFKLGLVLVVTDFGRSSFDVKKNSVEERVLEKLPWFCTSPEPCIVQIEDL